MDKHALMMQVMDELSGALGDSVGQRASGKPILEIAISAPGMESETPEEEPEEMPEEEGGDELDRRLAEVSGKGE